MILRHLLAVFILPGTVVVIVPILIARRYAVAWHLPAGPGDAAVQLLGVGVLAIGLILFGASLMWFVTEGRGTLAPWDPPRRLVVRGPYRFVRNPMISGVIFMLFGEALVLRSEPHAAWAIVFLALNLFWIPSVEEPQLEARFGAPYREYRRHVGRFIPRLRPWSGSDAQP